MDVNTTPQVSDDDNNYIVGEHIREVIDLFRRIREHFKGADPEELERDIEMAVAEVRAKEHTDFVAERIMGFKRGNCHGEQGWANITLGGDDIGFWCDWCGEGYQSGQSRPCPKYPFPKFSMVDLMRKLGENNYPLFLRFDHIRSKNRFTIVGPEGRICDTDTPLEDLCKFLHSRFGEKDAEVIDEKSG